MAIRIPDYHAAKSWYIEKPDFRILQEWTHGDLRLGYLSLANDDDFHIDLFGGPLPFPKKVPDDFDDGLKYGGFQHMCVHVDNINDVYTELARLGST